MIAFSSIADHPHFLEIDADRRQIFRNVADVLVLGAAGQDLTTDHQERGGPVSPENWAIRKIRQQCSSLHHRHNGDEVTKVTAVANYPASPSVVLFS